MLTGYLIDPTAATICKVRLNPSNIGAALRHHIGCKLLDRVWIDDRHFAHLDEEALHAPVTGLWYVPHSSPQPYAGRAVILAEARNGAVEEPRRPIDHFAATIRVARPVAVPRFTDIEPAPADAMGVNVIIGARIAGFKLELEDLSLSILQS